MHQACATIEGLIHQQCENLRAAISAGITDRVIVRARMSIISCMKMMLPQRPDEGTAYVTCFDAVRATMLMLVVAFIGA